MSNGGGPRSQRKDVVRNRARLLAAAREVFAERGLDATLDEVARHAGVGTGTAYRHFANKRELAAALFEDLGDRILADATAALAVADPWDGVVAFFETWAARQAADRGLRQMLTERGDVAPVSRVRDRLVETVARVLERAQRAGALRADVAATDIGPIFAMLNVAYDMAAATTPDLWRRYLGLVLDGLRATDRPPLPGAALCLDDLERAFAAVKAHRPRPEPRGGY